jgi:DNA repair ATPase RecN
VLLELHISRLGVIEDVTLELPPGLSVLTEETPAGKTMVTEGLALVLGRRGRAGMVRGGAGRPGLEARRQRVAEPSRMLSGLPTEEAATRAEQRLAEAAREKG